MKKIISVIICGLLLIATFAGCKKDGGGGNIIDDDKVKEGSITIAMPMGESEKKTLEEVIKAYKIKNPLVNVNIETKSADEYKDFLSNSLIEEDLSKISYDIIRNNEVSHFFEEKKFVDFSQYLSEENPYADNKLWKDGFDVLAYAPSGSKGEIFNLNFESTQIQIFYNQKIFDDNAIVAGDIKTWDDLIEVCKKLKEKKIIPFAVGGDMDSFFQSQLSWVFRTYVDQYFRSVAENTHSIDGDWNYDSYIDKDWTYKPYPDDKTSQEEWEKAYFNDNFNYYTKNDLRMLSKIMDKENPLGPDDVRYKSMLANLMEIFPKYAVSGFTTTGLGNAINPFWTEDAAMTIMTTDLFSEWKARKEINDNFFTMKSMDFPPMQANEKYPNVKPDVDYTRSVGGPHGFYGIINKSNKNKDLAIDFMMFWTSVEGQNVAMNKRKDLGVYINGVPYIKDIVIPDEINPLKDIKLKGICDNNPAATFARGLENEGKTTRDFQVYTNELFSNKLGFGKDAIEIYAKKMQKSMQDNMTYYLAMKGYKSDCLKDVTKSPF